MRRILAGMLAAALCTQPLLPAGAAETQREPYGIALEGFAYPYAVHMLPLVNDGEQVRMAYMDVAPAQPNGRSVVLLHGRNFPSSYWAPVIRILNEAGYRVIVPDQIGFGKSSKPLADLHFDTLARNTIALLDHLGIAKADIVAHSLGSMLGVRIARAFPDRIAHLVLTAPIGLEDYRLYVPPTPTEKDSGERGQAHRRGLSQATRGELRTEAAARAGHAVHRRAFQHQGQRRISTLVARLRQFRANDLPRAGGA